MATDSGMWVAFEEVWGGREEVQILVGEWLRFVFVFSFFLVGGRFLSLEIGVSSPGILKSPFFLLGNIYVSIRREKREKGFILKLNLLSYTHFSVWSSLCASLYNFKYWVVMFMQNLGRLVCVLIQGGDCIVLEH